MNHINLAELTKRGEIRNLSGHEQGVAARKFYKLAELDMKNEVVRVVVPDDIYLITQSFFQGMFAESVSKMGSREKFLRKYQFGAKATLLEQIDRGIERSLTTRELLIA